VVDNVKTCLLIFICTVLSSCTLLNKGFTPEEEQKFKDYDELGKTINFTNPVKVTFLGTSSLLISDNKSKILIDGVVSRPSIFSLVVGTKPDENRISALIAKYDLLGNLDAVIPVHSHHDHAMDAFILARDTGAQLVGTDSTFNIGKAGDIPDNLLEPAVVNHTYLYGEFEVTLLRTKHAHIPTRFLRWLLGMNKEIAKPIHYPARLWDYKESQPFSIHIKHNSGTMLVHASTSVSEGALKNVKADWVFLGISQLNKLEKVDQDRYFNETVAAVGASRVVPIHWDDIFRSRDAEDLYPANRLMGNFSAELLVLECQMLKYAKSSAIRLMVKNETVYLDKGNEPVNFNVIDYELTDCNTFE
jgi:L-ascorbate metabolism protein UlaG (beta-lactamase superfamily)